MHKIHAGLTVVAPVKQGEAGLLRDLLKLLNTLSVFDASDTTLFVTGVILPKDHYEGQPLEETFVFATSYCGPLENHLDDLIRTNGENLCNLFMYCENFSSGGQIAPEALKAYMKQHSHTSNHSSRYNFITKKDVEWEKDLRKQIELYIDKAQHFVDFKNLTPAQIQWLIQRHVRNLGENYAWALQRFKLKPQEKWAIIKANILRVAGLICIAVLGVLAIPLLRRKSTTAKRPPDCKVRRIAATQLNPVINSMTAAAPLKKGGLRRFFYASIVRITGWYSNLTLIVPTVSCIRWLSVNENRRLLFLSNYSNTTDFYVRDFLNGHTPFGVNFMFTHGRGFPDATLFFLGGIAKDPEGYMNAVHTGQVINDLWYTHEKSLTIDGIVKNRLIRKGLPRSMNKKNTTKWLRLL